MKRKILSLILVFAMTVSLFTVGTGAVEPTYGDTAGHWAESSIERWSGHGIIQGSNGQFDPNGQLTCAQLATILAKLLKLPAAKDAGFTDNTADAWYYDAINRCAAAGILNGNGDGTVTPEAPITRERAMVMLARALGIEPIRKPDLTKYTDAAQVSAYARGYVAALIEAGIVGGVTADELAPQDNINRASTVTILDRAISTYADKAGETVKVDGKGLVLVVAKNVKITGAPEGTKIVVADGATGLTVNGKSVSDDQTYIVPKTTTGSGSSSGGGHSHSYVYTDNGDGTHTGKCYANDSALSPEAHNHNGENGKCTVCGAAQTAASVASVKAADGTYTYYTTLAAALAAAKNGDTVKLTQDITPDERIVVTGNKNITIDLAEKKITSTADVAIVNDGNGKLTITGNGTVDTSSSTNDENIAIWARTGSIDIENGTFINKSNKEATVYVGTSENANEPVITIKGGTFKNSAEGTYTYNSSLKPLTLNVQNGKPVTSIVITGGTFYGNDPKNGDDNKGGTFLAPDYKSVETSAGSGVWTVSKMTWNEYPEDASVVPSGLLIQEYTNGDFNSNNGNTGTITIKDKEALLYFAYKLNPAAAHEACLADHSHWDHTCIWYGGACARHIVLNADIDLENITLENGFGNMKDFDFDGQDHKIGSVTINYNGTDNTGLFVGGNRGISNLVVENVKVNAPNGTENAVGIVSSDANADITNVTVRNSSVTGGKYTGAIVGYNYGSVANCKVENCTVSGRYKVGGIIGYICNSNDVPTYVTGNVLTGVTVKGENLVAGKNNFVIGKIVGNWNATVGECSGNTFSGTTVATEDIGEIESRCIVTVNGVTQLPQNATAETINKVITESKDAEGNVVKDVKLALPSKSTFELNNGLAHEGDKSRKVTIVGDGTQTVDVAKNAAKAEGANHLNYQRGSTFTFENVTVENGTGTYDGIVCDELIYRNCTIKGVTTLYGKATFIDCTFENEMANQYSIWTWGGTDVKFEGCTFNTNGKAILLFGEEKTTNLTVTGCRFNDRNNGTAGKAAIEIGEANYGKHNNFTVVISDSEVVTGFAINSNGTNTGSKLWANKNSMDSEHLSVTIDGTKVL